MECKKTIWIMALIFFLLTGCQRIAHLDTSQTIVSPKNNSIPLKGTWRFYDYKNVYHADDKNETIDNKDKIMEGTCSFTDEEAILGDEICLAANYQIRNVDTRDYFLFHYNMDYQDLEIENSMIDVISITSKGVLFFDILKITENRAIVYIDGSFYWLEKVSDEVDKPYNKQVKNNRSQEKDIYGEEELLRSGVLLGLSSKTSRSNYRTIWISSNNRRIKSTMEAPDLFVPRRSGFWILTHRTRQVEGFVQDHIQLEPMEASYGSKEDKEGEFTLIEGDIEKNILFLGDDYIAIEDFDNYRVLPLDDINSKKGILLSHIAEPGMEDIFYKSAQSHILSKGIKLSRDLDEIAKEDNFTLSRRNGNWILRGRLKLEKENEDFTIGMMPVDKLINYDELHVPWDIIKEKIPMALDAYTSPNKELLIVVTGNFIMVYTLDQGEISDKPLRKIMIKKGESVIMAEWATGDYVDRWEKSFNQVKPYMIEE